MVKTDEPDQPIEAKLTRDQVATVLGRIDDAKAAAIIATGAALSDLNEAVAWAAGESDVIGKLHRPASPVVAAVFAILTAEQTFADERD